MQILAMSGIPGATDCASWYTVDSKGLVGRSLADVDLWKKTGATIAALRQKGTTVPYPGPDLVLCEQDQIYVVGTAQQLKAVERLLELTRVHFPTYE
jgi:K+/H+ antiporter YhaU regulatory subunit KhtT